MGAVIFVVALLIRKPVPLYREALLKSERGVSAPLPHEAALPNRV
jgi:hypothetical protein